MIEHPYVGHGTLEREAAKASQYRMVYYGTLGIFDPRTYTIDAFALRLSGMTYMQAVRASMGMAVAGAAMLGSTLDPLNVTPGYGITPEGGTLTRDGIPVEYVEELLDVSQYYM
jgi:hypothetical protein